MLVLNGGSSSIKFAVFDKQLKKKVAGSINNIGESNCRLITGDVNIHFPAKDIPEAAGKLLGWLDEHTLLSGVNIAAHRIVQGMHFTSPQAITPALLQKLHQFVEFDPGHMPGELMLIKAVQQHNKHIQQVACFDTSFHQAIPRIAQLLPLPAAYYKKGIRRYGFHGMSYQYIMHALKKIDAPHKGKGRVIVAHLGNGASMAAILNGKSMDTSMGFTPTGGLMMGTRSGDFDPGVAAYLMSNNKMTAAQFNSLINRQSGLLGVSGISSDMQRLQNSKKAGAKEAVALFCYDVKKYIGAYTAVLQGIDTLVFTGGIGANSPYIRSMVCAGLEYLGISLNKTANKKNSTRISSPQSAVNVYAVQTDEEYMMAKLTTQFLARK